MPLVPQPLRMERKPGDFVLNKDTAILVERGSADATNVGEQLVERLNRATGLGLAVWPFDVAGRFGNAILLTTKKAGNALGPEGYTLEAAADGVVITAADGPGLFYGVQTLLQLLPPEIFSPTAAPRTAWTIPAVRIEDRPRFPWRQLTLDVVRHFFNKHEVENFIDLMAQHKFNTLQLHLTDDEGWRVEIKRYPELTRVGAWRKDIVFGLNPKDGTAWGPDGRYGGFFTREDVRELVAYAKARYVTIVPEIEMPSHSWAALRAYPEFGCPGGPFYMKCQDRMYGGVYCAGNDAAFEFLDNVLAEVLDLFPSRYIHIGGDEVPKDGWKQCKKCQARIRKESLKDENGLQSYFIRRIEKFLNARAPHSDRLRRDSRGRFGAQRSGDELARL